MKKSEKLSRELATHLSGGDFNPVFFQTNGFQKVTKDNEIRSLQSERSLQVV